MYEQAVQLTGDQEAMGSAAAFYGVVRMLLQDAVKAPKNCEPAGSGSRLSQNPNTNAS